VPDARRGRKRDEVPHPARWFTSIKPRPTTGRACAAPPSGLTALTIAKT